MHTLDDFLELPPASYLPLVARMAGKGATDVEIAAALGVSLSTLTEARSIVEGFDAAMRLGETFASERVRDALYRSAVGYRVETEKVFHNRGDVVRVPTFEYVKPDITAAKFWLVNRDPDSWADKTQVDVGDYGAALREAMRKAGLPEEEN